MSNELGFNIMMKKIFKIFNHKLLISIDENTFKSVLSIVKIDAIILNEKIGFDMIKKVKTNIPILLMLSDDIHRIMMSAINLGIKDIISKPFDPLVLLKKINENIISDNNKRRHHV